MSIQSNTTDPEASTEQGTGTLLRAQTAAQSPISDAGSTVAGAATAGAATAGSGSASAEPTVPIARHRDR